MTTLFSTDLSAPSTQASEIARLVKGGDISAVDVAAQSLARCETYQTYQPSTFIFRVDTKHIRLQAEEVDRRLKDGEELALAGVPFAVKDNIDVAGLPTTAGCPGFSYIADTTAQVVELLLHAGAILIGKTNLDQFATGLVGTRSPYGALSNVYNRDYISGGSSSGSAVAVAAGLVGFALGTDTAGSGRVPASFNGLLGVKPTRGLWSSRGIVPACRSLDCVSLFTQSLDDAKLCTQILTQFDADDPYARDGAERHIHEVRRIGVPKFQLDFSGDEESRQLFEQTIEKASGAGFDLVPVDVTPFLEAANLLYSGPWLAERSHAVGAFLSKPHAQVESVVKEIILKGQSISAVDTFEGFYQLQKLMHATEASWQEIDALLMPTAPSAFLHSQIAADPIGLNTELGRFTNFANLLDLAALALPAGYRANNTGFGVTLFGPAFSDEALLQAAERIIETLPSHRPILDLSTISDEIVLAVVGAHLTGMPLHHQLTSRGARLLAETRTAKEYELYALAESTPPKPGLKHVGPEKGSALIVETYALSEAAFGSFTAEVPPPLAIGTVKLENGDWVKGFVAEPHAFEGAQNITTFGGWRAFIEAKQ